MIITKEFLKTAKEANRTKLVVDKLKAGKQGSIEFTRPGNAVWSEQTARFECLGFITEEYSASDQVSTHAEMYIEEYEVWNTIIGNLKVNDNISITFVTTKYGSKGLYLDMLKVRVTHELKSGYKEYEYLVDSYPYRELSYGWTTNWYSREDYKAKIESLGQNG